MANNPLDRSSSGQAKKAGLTKPARIAQRRSLQPPPPSAVHAAKQKSLPPPPLAPSFDVEVDVEEEDDDATIVRDRSDFESFFSTDEDSSSQPALTESPWALPPVEARTELQTLADDAVESRPGGESRPGNAVPEDSDDDDRSAEAISNEDESATNDLGAALADPLDMFAGKTETEATQEIDEVEDVEEPTVTGNSKPSNPLGSVPRFEIPSPFGPKNEEPSAESLDVIGNEPLSDTSNPEDDLVGLFGRARKKVASEIEASLPTVPRNVVPRNVIPHNVVPHSVIPGAAHDFAGPPPPPPPGLRSPVPPAPAPEPQLAPVAPAAVLPNPAPNAIAAPLPPLPLPRSSASLPPLPPPPPASGSLPLPPIPLARGAAPALGSHAPALPSGMEFQDDDVTQIFDRGAGDSLPPMPSLPLPSFAPHPSTPPSVLTFTDAPPGGTPLLARKGVWGLLLAAIVVAAAVFMLWPSKGRLVVAVAGPNGTVVDGITVSLSGKIVCTNSPCEVNELEAKSYLVSVEAEGFEPTAPQAVIVVAGEDTVHNVQLRSPVVTDPTGLDILSDTAGLSLFIDGKSMGTLPQKVLELEPGEHTLRVSGGDRYEDAEKKITVVGGQVLTLQPFALKVKRGRATIEAGDNAEEALVQLDGKNIKLPFTADLDTSEKHVLTATREGHANFEKVLSFEDGKAEATFSVDLEPEGEEAESDEGPTANVSASNGKRRSSSSGSGGQGTLNIKSVPSAMVILDGRPIGKTPKMGVKVKPGAHSIVFVSSKGRKRATTKVKAGASKTVSVRF